MKKETERIKPLHAFSYIGGKSRYINKLYESFPQSYSSFYDVCGGSGVVTFSLPVPQSCKKIVLNDYDPTIYNFYATLKGNRGKELEEQLLHFNYGGYDKLDWEGDNSSLNCDGMDEVENAASTFRQIVYSFSGMRNCYTQKDGEAVSRRLKNNISLVRQRLQDITVTNRNFIEILKEIDEPDAFVYIDVPYRMATRQGAVLYKYELEEDVHDEMLDLLKDAPYKWALSGYREANLIEGDKYDLALSAYSSNTVEISTYKFGANTKAAINLWEDEDKHRNKDEAEKIEEDEIENKMGKPKAKEILWRNYS